MKYFLPFERKEGEEADPVAIVSKSLETLTATVGEQIAAVKKELGDRLDKVEAKAARPNGGKAAEEVDETKAAERKAYHAYLRAGSALSPVEMKALQVSSDPQGGIFAPAEQSTEFLRNLVELSPIRAIASVRTTSAPSVQYPKRTAITNAAWRGEMQSQTGSVPSFGQAEVVVRELSTFVDISNQLLQDGPQAEAEVNLALAEDFAQKEGSAFVNGDGVLAPEGFMVNADIAHTPNTHATNLSADALISLLYALPSAYRLAGTWVMNGSTLAAIRKLKDGHNNFLWQPSYQAGQPETILGRPVVEAIDMPDIAENAFPIVYGDFSGYRIIDRVGLSILVNPYLRATEGITRIHATRRVGGRVLQPAKFRKLKMAVS